MDTSIRQIGPLTTAVQAPFIIISDTPDDNKDNIVLSTTTGNLLSFTEDFNSEKGSYEIVLEVLDPDGLFISKTFSFYTDQLKTFFDNITDVKGNNNGLDNTIRNIYRNTFLELIRKDKNSVKDNDEYTLTEEKKSDISMSAIDSLLDSLGNSSAKYSKSANFKKLLDSGPLSPQLYLSFGQGNFKNEAFANTSGFRKYYLKNLVISQDTGREHILTIRLVPEFLSETEEDIRDTPNQSLIKESAFTLFPTSFDKVQAPIVFKGTFSVRNNYQEANALTGNLKGRPQIDNTKDIVFLIEELLESYLNRSGRDHGIVVISPLLELAIRQKCNPNGSRTDDSKFLHNLSRRLSRCGIRLKVTTKEDTGETETVTVPSSSGGTVLTGGSGAAYSRNESNVVKKILNYTFSLFLDLTDVGSRKKTSKEVVRDIIGKLYDEFSIRPRGVMFVTRNNDKIVKTILEQLYATNETIFSYKRDEEDFYYKPGIGNNYEGSDLARKVFPRNENRNLVIVGDESIIKLLFIPEDALLAEREFKNYEKYIKNYIPNPTPPLRCNVAQFVLGPTRKGFADYIEKIRDLEKSIKSEDTWNPFETLIPDEFAYRFDKDQIYSILKDTLVLIGGSENSNIYSITSKEDGVAFAEYSKFFEIGEKLGIDSAKRAFVQEYPGKDQVFNLTEDDKQDIVNDILLESLGNVSLVSMVERFLQKDIKETEGYENIKNLYLATLDELEKTPLVKNKRVSKEGITNYLAYLDNLSSMAKEIVVKIPPAFYINERYLNSFSILFHSNPFVSNSESPFSKVSLLTGMYKIIGYKHTITDSECHTELVLLRNNFSEYFNPSIQLEED